MDNSTSLRAISAPAAKTGSSAGWLEQFRTVSPWPLIAFSRCALAVFSLLAIYADPNQPVHGSEAVYYLLAGFVIYSGVLAISSFQVSPGPLAWLLAHAVDITVFSILLYLTDGATSPYFVFFTFALFSATLRWNWRGAVLTTVATAAIYGVLAATSDISLGVDATRTIMRSAYQLVAGVLFAYFGAILERERLKFANLAAWPPPGISETVFPELQPTLAHIAAATDLNRILVVWENDYEPHLFLVEFDAGTTRQTALALSMAEALGPFHAIRNPAIISSSANHSGPVPTWLSTDRGVRHGIVAPISGSTISGHLILADSRPPSEHLLPIMSIAALRVGTDIEQHLLRMRLIEAAAENERSRLARDIHDGLLQSLTAIGLQLKRLESNVPSTEIQRVWELRRSVEEQQARLRHLVDAAREGVGSWQGRSMLANSLGGLVGHLQVQWDCTVSLSLDPPDLAVGHDLSKELSMFVAEAVANGVRHGKATEFSIKIETRDRMLAVRLSDNGSGLPDLSGRFSPEAVVRHKLGSTSLRERAASLGGRMALSSSPKGLEIILTVGLS